MERKKQMQETRERKIGRGLTQIKHRWKTRSKKREARGLWDWRF